MAQKSLKTLAARNTATLNRTHLIALGVHGFYLLLRLFLVRRRLLTYIFLSLPALGIEFWFEQIGRPKHHPGTGELKSAGEDLEAKGLTEWMWDVVYWSWGCAVLVALVGDVMWWLYLVIPGYSAWLAVSTYTGMGKQMGGLMGNDEGKSSTSSGGQSKRQAKMEKRGGQKMPYR